MDPGGLATPVGLVDPEDPATPVGRVDPAGRVTVADPGDMNRVAAATVGTAAAMAPADLASRAVPVVRVGMTPAVRMDPVGMILEDPEGRLRHRTRWSGWTRSAWWYRTRWPGRSRGTGKPRI